MVCALKKEYLAKQWEVCRVVDCVKVSMWVLCDTCGYCIRFMVGGVGLNPPEEIQLASP
jgi:hypothetical protein